MHVVDLSNPAKPVLLPKITQDNEHESVAVIANGSDLWLNYKRPTSGTDPKQAQAKFYARRIDFSKPSAPVMGKEINVPGQLMAIVGNQFYTKDFHWNAKSEIEHSLELLTVQDDLAYSQASLRLENQQITNLLVDNAKVIASTSSNLDYSAITTSLFSVAKQSFVVQSSLKLGQWNYVRDARNGKVLLNVEGGILLYDFNQSTPLAQAFLPIENSWSSATIIDQQIYVPAHAFGIYQFDFAMVNLSKP